VYHPIEEDESGRGFDTERPKKRARLVASIVEHV
jgi:hypothetical protein